MNLYQVGDRDSTIYELDLFVPVGSFFEDKLYQVYLDWNSSSIRENIGLTQDTNVVFQQHFFISLDVHEDYPDIEPFLVTVNVNH